MVGFRGAWNVPAGFRSPVPPVRENTALFVLSLTRRPDPALSEAASRQPASWVF